MASDFEFVGGERRAVADDEIREEDILKRIKLGSKEVMAVKKDFPKRGGGFNRCVMILGVGKPTTFGAEKHIAWKQLEEAITDYFVEIGQLRPRTTTAQEE